MQPPPDLLLAKSKVNELNAEKEELMTKNKSLVQLVEKFKEELNPSAP